jgi:hypothetical protein
LVDFPCLGIHYGIVQRHGISIMVDSANFMPFHLPLFRPKSFMDRRSRVSRTTQEAPHEDLSTANEK